MVDTEDFDNSDEEFNDGVLENIMPKLKRDFRLEIERKLELIELRRKTGDYYSEEIFN